VKERGKGSHKLTESVICSSTKLMIQNEMTNVTRRNLEKAKEAFLGGTDA